MSGEPFPNVPSEPANSSAGEAGQTPASEEPILASLADDAIVDLIPADASAGEPVLLRLTRPERPRPGFLMAVVWCLFLLAVQLVISFIAGFIGAAFALGNVRELAKGLGRAALREEIMERLLPWAFIAGTLCTVVFAFILVGAAYRKRFARLAAWRDCFAGQLSLGLLLLAAVLVVETELNVRVNQGLEALFGRPSEWTSSRARTSYLPIFDEEAARIARLPWWLLLVGGCLFPGVGEELLFRGYIGRGLVGRYGPVAGVLLTSLLFGLVHIEPVRVCATALLGVVLHVVYLATKSLWAPIVLHALNNVLAIGQRKLAGDDAASMIPATDPSVPPLLLLAAFVAALAAGWLLYKTRTRWTLPGGDEWSPGYVSAERPPAITGAFPRSAGVEWTLLTAVLCVYAIFPVYLGILIGNWVGPEGPPAQLEQADLHFERGEYEKASAAYSRVLEGAPDSVRARLNRGLAKVNLGDDRSARADFDHVIRSHPDDWRGYNTRGRMHYYRQSYSAAVDDYSKAIELAPESAELFLNRAAAYRMQGLDAPALADYQSAVKLDASNASTHNMIAWIQATSTVSHCRDGASAIRHAQEACKLTRSEFAPFVDTLAAAYAEAGQFQAAVRWQEQALQLAPPHQKAEYQERLDLFRARRPYREQRIPGKPGGPPPFGR